MNSAMPEQEIEPLRCRITELETRVAQLTEELRLALMRHFGKTSEKIHLTNGNCLLTKNLNKPPRTMKKRLPLLTSDQKPDVNPYPRVFPEKIITTI